MTFASETTLVDESATVSWGGQLLAEVMRYYGADALIFLQGQLGAGKTTLVRGMLSHLGYQGVVKSPTYTLLEPYEINSQRIYHFDLYRVNDPQELEFVGIDEIVDGPGIKIFEWPEQAAQWLPEADVLVTLEVTRTEAGVEPGRLARAVFNHPAVNDGTDAHG